MNNIKKLALGLLVAAFAFGFSAFKSAQKVDEVRYVQTDTDLWEKVDPAVYNSSFCEDDSEKACFYLQNTSDPTDHGASLTSAQINLIPSMQPSATEGLYVGPIN